MAAHGSTCMWLNYIVKYLGLSYTLGTAHRDAKYHLPEHGHVYACTVARTPVRLCPFELACVRAFFRKHIYR
jgi:hypothetical protein